MGISKEAKAFYIGTKFVRSMDFIAIGSNFYKYNEGIWEKVDDQVMSSKVSTEYSSQEGFDQPSTYQIKEVYRVIRDKTIEQYEDSVMKLFSDDFYKNEVNLSDCILDLETMNKREYTKQDFVFSKLPFSYDHNRQIDCPVFFDFLYSMFGDKEDFTNIVEFIQEWFGYSLIHGNKYHICLIMVGAGRNGKGTLINLLGKLIGKSNYSSIDLSAMSDGQHIVLTKNKLVNFSGELSHGQQFDTGIIKDAIAEGMVTGKEVYKKPETFKFTAKIIVATNELPYVKSVDVNVRDRLHILPFHKTFEKDKKDVNLGEKLEKELESIFAWSIQGLLRLKNRGGFKLPQVSEYALDEYLYEQDPISLWIDEDQVRKDGSNATRQQCYTAYARHCKDSGKKPLKKTNFYKKMKQIGFEEIKIKGYFYYKDTWVSALDYFE